MKKYLQFIFVIAFFAINITAKSQEKVFDLKDKYYNCGSRDFSVIFKTLDGNRIKASNFLTIPNKALSGEAIVILDVNTYRILLSDIQANLKVIFYENYEIDTITGNVTYDEIQSFEVIKLDTLPKPTISQISNKLVSNIEGPHRWYFGPTFTNRFEDTPNNEYIPQNVGYYSATVINPDYDCVSLESNRIEYIVNSVENDDIISSNKFNITGNTITFFEVNGVEGINETNTIEIYNVLGEKINLNKNNISKNNNSIAIEFDSNFNRLNAGMYLIVLKDNNNSLHKFTFVK